VATLASLGVALAVMIGVLPSSAERLANTLASAFTRAATVDSGAGLSRALWQAGMASLGVFIPFAGAIALSAIVVSLLQTGFRTNWGAIGLNFARLNPLAGIGKLFGTPNLAASGQSILKLAAIGAALYVVMDARLHGLEAMLLGSEKTLLAAIFGSIVAILSAAVMIQVVSGAVDFVLVRNRFSTSVKMSRQEVKDEQKETDGDPHVRARIKAARSALAKRSLNVAMARAAVVITNPTHYAVALEYRAGQAEAPKIVAKGADERAARIRDLAREARIPIVANPPLARALFQQDVETEILPEHYRAVAEIIAYIWKLAERQMSRI
jgi:flagellar biosynthetic protein FlhB